MNDADWLRKRLRRKVGCLVLLPAMLYLATLFHPALVRLTSDVGQ
jgi:hypothetical protein